MKRIALHTVLLIFCSCIFINTSTAITLYSIANGNWSTKGVWSYTQGGPSCNCTPISSDDVNIYHTITLDMHLTNQGSKLNGITGILTIFSGGFLNGGTLYDIDIRSTGTLIMECGNVTGRDITFSNGSTVSVCSTAVLNVNGNFENKNNSDHITMNGTMNVTGSYTNGTGASIGGTGTINITTGPVTNPGSTFGCQGMDPCGGSFPCTIVYPCNFALSNELKSFEVKKEGSGVSLEWITISEQNSEYFSIERSANGMDFEAIQRVEGAGTSTEQKAYTAVDKSPLEGINYYRLNQVNFDGGNQYSEILTVTISLTVTVTLFPNPITDEKARLKISGEESGKLYIEIRDYSGRNTYLKKEFIYDSQHTTINLDEIQAIPNGVYIAAVKSDQYVYNEMLIIAR